MVIEKERTKSVSSNILNEFSKLIFFLLASFIREFYHNETKNNTYMHWRDLSENRKNIHNNNNKKIFVKVNASLLYLFIALHGNFILLLLHIIILNRIFSRFLTFSRIWSKAANSYIAHFTTVCVWSRLHLHHSLFLILGSLFGWGRYFYYCYYIIVNVSDPKNKGRENRNKRRLFEMI